MMGSGEVPVLSEYQSSLEEHVKGVLQCKRRSMLVKTNGATFQPVLEAQECEVRRRHDQAVTTSMKRMQEIVESVCNMGVVELWATHRTCLRWPSPSRLTSN